MAFKPFYKSARGERGRWQDGTAPMRRGPIDYCGEKVRT